MGRRKTIKIPITRNHDLLFRARAPCRDSTYAANDLLVFRFGGLRQINPELSKFVKLQDGPAKLKTVARIVGYLAFSSRDDDLLITHRLVVEVSLIREMKGVSLKIKSLRPDRWVKCGEGAKERK